jgi:uncharacterized protein YeaO (DUF488 family)
MAIRNARNELLALAHVMHRSQSETKTMIKLKRAYGPASRSDGERLLVERLWPRGLRKDDAHFDAWLKEIAPSDELRKWFGHDPARFREFRERYKRELHHANAKKLLDELAHRAARRTVTLVYSAHDEEHNNAIVLAEEIERRIRRAKGSARASP